MAYTLDSKVKDIMAEPKAVEILEKYVPGFSSNKRLKMVYSMSLRDIAKFPQSALSPELLEKIEIELKTI